MKWLSHPFPKGPYLYCAKGSHLSLDDDQTTWFTGVLRFLQSDARSGG